jgi:hypothetical protein
MSREPKLELTWIQAGGRRQPSLYFEAGDAAEGDSTRYAVARRVCAEPRCDCYSVRFYCRPIVPDGSLAPADRSREFWLDLWDRSPGGLKWYHQKRSKSVSNAGIS